jgi:hypothetical protein
MTALLASTDGRPGFVVPSAQTTVALEQRMLPSDGEDAVLDAREGSGTPFRFSTLPSHAHSAAGCCPACRSIVPLRAIPQGSELGDVIRSLQQGLPPPVNQPPLPIVPVIDWRITVPVLAQQPEDDAHSTYARTVFVSGMEGSSATLHVSAPADKRWYVVRKGKGFTGVVQGSHIFTAMVADVPSASGARMATRDDAELAWRWAHAYGGTALLSM